MNTKTYLLLFIITFASCVAKKTVVEYKEVIVKDTVNVEVLKTVIKPVKETLYIESPCDSLGVLKQFSSTFKTEKASVKIYNDKGNIKADINIDSILDIKIKEFKSNYVAKVETKEAKVVKYKYPLWLIIILLSSVVLNGLLLRFK